MATEHKRIVIQVGDTDYVGGVDDVRLSATIEQIEWIDAATNTMCCAPGIAMWQLWCDGCDVLCTTVPPKRVESDSEVRYIFPGPLRLTGTYDEQRQAAIDARQVADNGNRG